ncbi:MAG TPA: NmrA family NAD(P)-binding protein, partial [Kineosporiaceae bacterium]|nr:NmrA family NAD(P)-binding protein [Kineosporiaceae bacterium]
MTGPRPAAVRGAVALFGGAGKTGRAVAAALIAAGVPVESIRPLVRIGQQGPGEGGVDLDDDASVSAAVAGAGAIHVLAPNMHQDEVAVVRRAVAAARAAGVRRVVYHSVLRPGVRAMPHHWHKLEAEGLLWESGLDVTVLQPSAYAQNLIPCVQGSRIVVPYAVDVPFSLVDLADVAEVTARMLTEPGHGGATYELAGPVTTIEALAGRLGLDARRERPAGAGDDAARGSGGYPAGALRAMFDWYDLHGLAGNPG